MRIYSGAGVNDVYATLINDCMEAGADVPILRKGAAANMTKEIHPAIITLDDPTARLVTSYGRPVNVAFALAEVLWILNGREDVGMLAAYNSQISNYSDDGVVFNAAYGARLRRSHHVDQLEDIVTTLRNDPSSRQAVMAIWHPAKDKGWMTTLRGEFVRLSGDHEFGPIPRQTKDRACNLLSHAERERVALQAHIPLPRNFGSRIVLQFLREGYSGQAPVNETALNLCLVGTPPTISRLRQWAQRHFEIPADQPWRTITPLTRAPVACAHENLLLIGDAARVVEPFTGEGIYYALRSGELAAGAIAKIISGKDRQLALREFARASDEMYRGRLWINRLARAAVLSPRIGSLFVRAARINPSILKLLTTKIVRSSPVG